MDWQARIRAALGSGPMPADDVIEELAQHAAAAFDAERSAGVSDDEATERVQRLIETWCSEAASLRRPARGSAAVTPPPAASASMTAGIAQDLRFAARLIVRQPRFALLVTLTMAMAIAPASVLFSICRNVLAEPLPWPAAERVVVLKESRGRNAPRFGSFSNAAYVAWQGRAETIENIAAWSTRTQTLTGSGEPERIRVTSSTASLFDVLGITPIAGALFRDADETTQVVLLSESLWRSRFGGDPAALGGALELDGQSYTIVGVVADAMGYPDRQTRAWIPFRVPLPEGNLLSMFGAVASLRPGVSQEQVMAEGAARGRFMADTGPTTVAIFGGDGPLQVAATPLREAITREVRLPLVVLLVAAVLLLVVATTNVTALQLTRAIARRRETAIRAAIGADLPRLIRQLVAESLVLGLVGGAAGFASAWLLERLAIAMLPADFPRLHELVIGGGDPFVAVGLAVAASLVFSLVPAIQLRRLDLVETLGEDGTSPAGVGLKTRVGRSRSILATTQVAVAYALLAGAALLGRSFLTLLHVDRGFDADRVLMVPIPMTSPGVTSERRLALLDAIVGRLEPAVGKGRVAFASESPLTPGGSTSSLTLPSPDGGPPVQVQASPRLVSPAFFSTLGLRIVAGRSLLDSDTPTSRPVAVVNETFARRYLGKTPLDARIPMGVWGDQPGEASIVGIVEDVRYVGTTSTTLPEMYFAHGQIKEGMQSPLATLLVRIDDASAGGAAAAARAAIREADAALVPGAIMTLEDRLLMTSLARPRLYAALVGLFAVVAVLVTGVGLFGVLSYGVAQRTRELAVRAALGANRRDLSMLVLRQGMVMALGGAAAGFLASACLFGYLRTLLFGVEPFDPVTYALVFGGILAVAAAASVVPAQRAARSEIMSALH